MTPKFEVGDLLCSSDYFRFVTAVNSDTYEYIFYSKHGSVYCFKTEAKIAGVELINTIYSTIFREELN